MLSNLLEVVVLVLLVNVFGSMGNVKDETDGIGLEGVKIKEQQLGA